MSVMTVLEMGKKIGRPRGQETKTIRITLEAWEASRKAARAEGIDHGLYASKALLIQSPKDYKAAVRNLDRDEN